MHELSGNEDLAGAADAFLIASRALVGVAARSLPDADDVTLQQFRALIVLSRADSQTASHWPRPSVSTSRRRPACATASSAKASSGVPPVWLIGARSQSA